MRVRQKCLRLGHDFREYAGVLLPVVTCRRWFCDAQLVPSWVWAMAPSTAAALDEMIPKEAER